MRTLILPLALFSVLLSAAQATNDARIVENVSMRYPCAGVVKPVLKISNDGSEAMSGCVVETWKNNVLSNVFDWQLAVPAVQGEVRQPAFPEVDVVEGDVIEMRIISVNTIPDQVAEGNSAEFGIGPEPAVAESYLVEVRTQAGMWPGAVSWSIQDSDAAVVFESGTIALEADESASEWLELDPSSCYTLVTQDEGFAGGTVSVQSLDADVVVFAGGGTFPEDRQGFTTGTLLSVSERDHRATLTLFPVPASGPFTIVNDFGPNCTISLLDATGRVVYTTFGAGTNIVVDPGFLSEGKYQVVLNDKAGNTLRAPLVVVR